MQRISILTAAAPLSFMLAACASAGDPGASEAAIDPPRARGALAVPASQDPKSNKGMGGASTLSAAKVEITQVAKSFELKMVFFIPKIMCESVPSSLR